MYIDNSYDAATGVYSWTEPPGWAAQQKAEQKRLTAKSQEAAERFEEHRRQTLASLGELRQQEEARESQVLDAKAKEAKRLADEAKDKEAALRRNAERRFRLLALWQLGGIIYQA